MPGGQRFYLKGSDPFNLINYSLLRDKVAAAFF